MNVLCSTLEYIDIFGIPFQFTTFNKAQFNTIIGGIMTLMCGGIFVLFSLSFGGDFFYKTHPRILSQIVTPKNYSDPIPMTPDNFVLPFRLSDEIGNTLDINTNLYLSISYLEEVIDTTGTTVKVEKFLNYSKCDKTKVRMKEFTDNFSSDSWYCMDLSGYNYTLGGYWDASFINYLAFTISICPYGVSINNQNCSRLDDVRNYFAVRNVYFDILYPDFYFDAESLDEPYKMTFSNYFYKLNLKMKKIDRLFFKQAKFEDDQGWMMSNLKYFSTFGYADLKYDLGVANDEDYSKIGSSSEIYRCYIYTQKKYELTKRYFMKFQELAAILGGFMKIVITIGTYLSVILIHLIRDRIIITQLFNQNVNNMRKQSTFNLKVKDFKVSSLTKSIINKPHDSPLDNSKSILNNVIEKKENSMNLIKNFKRREKYDTATVKLRTRLEKLNKITNIKVTNNTELTKHKPISLWSLFKINYLILNNKNLDSNSLIIKTMNDYVKEKFDVFHYLQDSETIYKIRYLLFGENQNLCLSLINVYEIEKKLEVDKFYERRENMNDQDYNDIILYFKNNCQDPINRKILEILNVDISNLDD